VIRRGFAGVRRGAPSTSSAAACSPKPSLKAYVQPIDASPTPTPATDLARVQGRGSQRQQTRPICFTWIRRPQTRHKPRRLSEPRRRITSSTRGAYRWRVSRDARLRGGRRFTATGVNCDGGQQFRVPEILSVGAGHICSELKSVSLGGHREIVQGALDVAKGS